MQRTQSLFREQAFNQQRESIWGDVIIKAPMPYSIFSIAVAAIFSLVIFFLFSNSYASKQAVSGYITPDTGTVKIYAAKVGHFEKIYVGEQQAINKGDLLVSIVSAQYGGQGQDIYDQQAEEIQKQKNYILQQIQNNKESLAQSSLYTDNQIVGVQQEIASLEQQQHLLAARLEIANSKYLRAKELLEKNIISRNDFETIYDVYLQTDQSIKELDALKTQQQSRLSTLEQSRLQSMASNNTKQFELEASLSQLNGQTIQLDSNQTTQIIAPISGTVTGVQIQAGDTVRPNFPILTILPNNHQFIAHFYVPTRAIGRLEIGQKVRFKYDAFPYQKYGVYDGAITDITKNIFRPDELDIPVAVTEPSYRITVALAKQDVEAFGKSFYLQAGMTLQAEIIYDNRSLIKWLLEPLYSLKG